MNRAPSPAELKRYKADRQLDRPYKHGKAY